MQTSLFPGFQDIPAHVVLGIDGKPRAGATVSVVPDDKLATRGVVTTDALGAFLRRCRRARDRVALAVHVRTLCTSGHRVTGLRLTRLTRH